MIKIQQHVTSHLFTPNSNISCTFGNVSAVGNRFLGNAFLCVAKTNTVCSHNVKQFNGSWTKCHGQNGTDKMVRIES